MDVVGEVLGRQGQQADVNGLNRLGGGRLGLVAVRRPGRSEGLGGWLPRAWWGMWRLSKPRLVLTPLLENGYIPGFPAWRQPRRVESHKHHMPHAWAGETSLATPPGEEAYDPVSTIPLVIRASRRTILVRCCVSSVLSSGPSLIAAAVARCGIDPQGPMLHPCLASGVGLLQIVGWPPFPTPCS